MTLKVIGAGFGRTGTLSTQRALEMLYEAPCYHMEVVLSRPSHLDAWHDFSVHGRPMDWQALLGGFAAAVDFPICNHFETLMGEFPDARVVLNTRDPEAWWRSLEAMISKMKWLRVARLFSSRARRFGRFIEVEVLQGVFGGELNRERCIAAYEAHNAKVRQVVPVERLLTFDVRAGWAPLCEFLERPVPAAPFPHVNQGTERVEQTWRDAFGSSK